MAPPFLRNAGALYLVQIVSFVVPVLEIPLLARALGVSLYGQVLFCQALALMLSLVVEYGFGIHAAQQVALARGQRAVLKRLVSQVLLAKGLLAAPVVAVMLLVWALGGLDQYPGHIALLGFVLAYFLAFGFSAWWYFQGLEQMALPAFLDVALRLTGLGGLALWVQGPRDFDLALPLLAVPPLLSTVWITCWCRRQVGPLVWDPAGAWQQIRQGLHFFIYRSASSLAIAAVPVLLGATSGKRAVGEFAPAEKLIKGMVALGMPFLTAIFPVFSRRLQGRAGAAALRLPVLVLLGVAITVTAGAALAWWLGPWVLDAMLGDGYPGARPVYAVLLVLAPMRILNQSIALVLLIPAGHAKAASYAVSVFSVLGLLVGAGLSTAHGGVGMAAGLVGVEAVLLLTMLLLSWRLVHQAAYAETNTAACEAAPCEAPTTHHIAIVSHHAVDMLIFRGDWMRDLAASGVQVHALAPNYTDMERQAVRQLGARPLDYSLSRSGMNPLRDVADLARLFRLLRRLRPDTVFVSSAKPVIYGLLAAWMARVPRRVALIEGAGYVYTAPASGWGVRRRLLRNIVSVLYRLSLAHAQRVIFLNPDDQQQFMAHGAVRPEQATLLGGIGVDLAVWAAAEPVRAPMTFLMVARLLREKGVLEFAQAAARVKQQHPETCFVLLGGLDSNPGSLTAEEVRAWVDAGVLEWPGYVAVSPWMRQASVFVLPSYREGVPRSTQEAMAMGRPIVTTDAPGCRETVIDGINGYQVPVRDVDALVRAMMRFIQDPDSIAVMGAASRRLAEERFDVRQVNARLTALVFSA